MNINGVWVPVITPFKEDKVDFTSYQRLVEHYISEGVSGIMPVATTGEVPTLSEYEYEEIVAKSMEFVNGRIPVFVGLGGNNTKAVINKLKIVDKYKVDGILSVSPYYNRPDQRGIYEHFNAISQSTDLDIVLYNIPYRTGRNIENETLFRLAQNKNIIGVKDASGDFNKTIDLLLNRPEGFSVLSGEDNWFYSSLVLGGDGGIVASSHLRTKDFVKVYNDIKNNNHNEALKTWVELGSFIPLLFTEPNPTPIKYVLSQKGLIDSGEARLPLVEITEALKKELEILI